MFNNHIAHNLYRIMFMATSGVCMMKMGTTVHRVEIESIYHAFWASVLTITSPRFHDVIILPASTCLYSYWRQPTKVILSN